MKQGHMGSSLSPYKGDYSCCGDFSPPTWIQRVRSPPTQHSHQCYDLKHWINLNLTKHWVPLLQTITLVDVVIFEEQEWTGQRGVVRKCAWVHNERHRLLREELQGIKATDILCFHVLPPKLVARILIVFSRSAY